MLTTFINIHSLHMNVYNRLAGKKYNLKLGRRQLPDMSYILRILDVSATQSQIIIRQQLANNGQEFEFNQTWNLNFGTEH